MTTSYDAAKEWGRQGKVGIVICISRYVYMMEFESASAFLDQLFKKRPTSANYTHSQLRKKMHWSDIQQILTFTFGFIHRINIWYTIGPRLSSTQQTTKTIHSMKLTAKAPENFVLAVSGWPFWGEHLGCSTHHRWGQWWLEEGRIEWYHIKKAWEIWKRIGKFTTKRLL